MDKLKYVKLEQPDGSYSDSIPLAVDADHVDVNGSTLTNVLSNKADNTDIDNLQTEVNSLASGSPLVASSISEMTDTSRIYVNTTDGHWYWYNGSSWVDGGVYQSTGIGSNTVGYEELKSSLKEFFENNIQLEIGSISSSNGRNISTTNNLRCRTNDYILCNENSIFGFINSDEYMFTTFYYNTTDKSYHNHDSKYNYSLKNGNTAYYVRFLFKKKDDTSITDIDMEKISQTFVINDKRFINIESDIKHNFQSIDLKYLDINSQTGIKRSLLNFTDGYNEMQNFINGNINSNGEFTKQISYDNKVNIGFFEQEKIIIYLKQGFQCKLVNYDLNGEFFSDTSYTQATNQDVEVLYDVSEKGKVVVASLTQASEGTYTINDMIENIGHKSLKKEADNDSIIKTNNFIHFSFDDVSYTFKHIADNKELYNSIFDESFMKYLKQLHENYGAKFSLYVYNIENLNTIGDKFRQDFIENNHWLKIGFHAEGTESFANITTLQAKAQYDKFIDYAIKMAGLNSIDRIPRLNLFAGTQEQIDAIKNTECGIYGLLTPDDDRVVGYLNTNQRDYLYNNNHIFDKTKGLIFYATNFRLDTFVNGFTSNYNYHENTESTPYDELVYRYSNKNFANYNQNLIVFTHEWQVYNANYTFRNDMKSYIEQTLEFANDYGYVFDYIQNRVENINYVDN